MGERTEKQIKREAINGDEEATTPHDVVVIQVEKDCSLIKAWRLYRKKTQGDIAEALGIITQSAYSQIENGDKPHDSTLEKVAAVLDLGVGQLTEH